MRFTILTTFLAALALLSPAVASAQHEEWDWGSPSSPRERGDETLTWSAFVDGEGERGTASPSDTGVWDAFLSSPSRTARASAVDSARGCVDTVLRTVQEDEELSLLLKAIRELGLGDTLEGPGHVTLFAPTDTAFINLGSGERSGSALAMDLADVIRYHISPERVGFSGGSQTLASLTGERVTVSGSRSYGFRVNEEPVLETRDSCNGQVVKLNSVLLPRSPPPAPKAPDCNPVRECCDLEPPEFTCEEQVAWGKCEEDWIKIGKYCRRSCGFCIPGGTGDRSASEIAFEEDEEGNNLPMRSGDPLSDYAREGLLYQHWADIPGWRISDLSNNPKMLESPTVTTVFDSRDDVFEAPAVYARARNSVSRMSGFFCAPITGDYIFTFTSDDSGRLYMADSPVDPKRRLAKVSGSRGPEDYVSTRAIFLEKGKSYFLEAMQKQMDGPGHLKVGVELPSGAELIPIPSTFFSLNCKRMPDVDSLPEVTPEEACACTEDGYSGPSENRVQTGRRGCFTYDFRDDLVGGAERLGERFGQSIGGYFQNVWGAEEGTASRLASYWGRVASTTANANENTNARICYVKHPESCPIAVPSREIRGAGWRRC
ncbi:hypothetical protein HOP50_01g02500 [Chloropicon primus]|nr:hypothetical protein HOP50_01g02500 [Chloropicon primus]